MAIRRISRTRSKLYSLSFRSDLSALQGYVYTARTGKYHEETSCAKSMIGKIIMIVGILGVLLGAAVLFISLLLPVVTDGRTSWDEALLGIIPGAFVLTISFIIFVAGLIVVLMKRKKKLQLSQVVSQP